MNMKQLVYEYTERIAARQQYANQLVSELNQVLNRFKEKHNHFSQPIDEAFAFQLVSQPIETYDELLRVNSPVKPIAGKLLDVSALATLCGIDRPAWIAAVTGVLPGSVDRYNRAGVTGLLSLKGKDRHLVAWEKDHFIVNKEELATDCELYRVFATTSEQLAELEFWQGVAYTFNCLLLRGIIDRIDANAMQDRIKMLVVVKEGDGVKFVPDDAKLAEKIAAMAVN